MHQNPELSFQEVHTTAYLTEELKKIPGLTLEFPTKTGVVAVLKGVQPGPVLALRADIDALPIQEETGLPYASTMRFIIIPQAVKNILPALGNELITLLKDTSVVTVIGLRDLTKAAQLVQGKTYQAFMPYVGIAAMYLAMVMILSGLMGIVERRLRASD